MFSFEKLYSSFERECISLSKVDFVDKIIGRPADKELPNIVTSDFDEHIDFSETPMLGFSRTPHFEREEPFF